MGFLKRKKEEFIKELEKPRKTKPPVKENIEGNNLVLDDGDSKVILNTYVSKVDCAPAKNIDKFISNALKLARTNNNPIPWVISKFEIDSVIKDAINSADSVVTFSDSIKPSGITNIATKKKMEVR